LYTYRRLILVAFIFGGALLGFCLARAMFFSPSRSKKETTSGMRLVLLSDHAYLNVSLGEYFWFDRPFYNVNYLIHIYLTLSQLVSY
jgi:hypothetical protein